jgi:hypothetical protein
VRGYHSAEPVRRPQAQQPRSPVLTPDDDEDENEGGGGRGRKKKYYN